MPPGTLPPVVLPYDPTSATPVCLVALDSATQGEATLFDVGRYEVRPQIMSQPGAIAPLVYGGKVRAVMMYLDRVKLQARHLSPMDVMKAVDEYNVFLPTGSAKFGTTDYAIDSNSMFDVVGRMADIPLRNEHGNAAFLRDVATPKDANFIQTNVVRVNGKRQVYVPVFRQLGSSTLDVVNNLKGAIDKIQARLTRPGIDLKVVLDQSVYVRHSIESLVEEGVLGAVLCSLVILLFLGEWRMTVIAVLTIPIAVLASLIGLYASGNTINVMTLAGLSLAIGPMVDSAIICLENTHRHLGLGATPEEAAFRGASEVAMPELVASLCTLLVLAPLALMPGLGEFLYRPMAAGVAFAMIFGLLPVADVRPVPLRTAGSRPHAAARTWNPTNGNGHDGHHDPLRAAPAADDRRAARRGLLRRALRPLGSLDRSGDRLVRPPAQPRDELSPHRGAGRGRAAGGDPGRAGDAAAPRVLPRGRFRRLRDVRQGGQRHPHRGDREANRQGRGVRPQDDRRGPPDHHLRARGRRRPVGRLHPQRRADGCGRQGSAQTRARALGPGIRRAAPHRAGQGSRSSATWSLPSTPAA